MTRGELERAIADRCAQLRPTDPCGWCYDMVANVSTWTPCMYRLLGLPQGDGKPSTDHWLSLYTPDSRERVIAASVAAVAHDGGTFDAALSIRHSSGSYLSVRVVGRVTFQNGQPAFVDGTMTELRQYQYG